MAASRSPGSSSPSGRAIAVIRDAERRRPRRNVHRFAVELPHAVVLVCSRPSARLLHRSLRRRGDGLAREEQRVGRRGDDARDAAAGEVSISLASACRRRSDLARICITPRTRPASSPTRSRPRSACEPRLSGLKTRSTGCTATGLRSFARSASFASTAAASMADRLATLRFGASKLTSSSSRSITVDSRRAPMFSVRSLTS